MNQKIFALLLVALVFLFGCNQPAVNDAVDDLSDEGTGLAGGESPEAEAPEASGGEGGTVAGAKPTYEPFTQEKYDAAKAAGKTIFLEFYANWCPICRDQKPEIESAFNELADSRIAGFQVNYNDSETDDNERNLARKFGISYQHTHVIIDSSENVLKKELTFWGKEKILEALSAAAS